MLPLACLLVPLLLSSRADAQEVERLKQLSLEQLLNVPIEAASTIEQRPSDVPASAYVVTEETIRARGYSTLLDLIEDLPQFEIQHKASETRRNIVTVRGLFGNERLVILYNGIRVTPPSGDIYALGTQFSLRNAKRVEIVVGPMSALYGPDAASAVINVVTKSGSETSDATVQGAYGQYETQDVSVSAGGALDTLPFTTVPFLSGAELSVTAHRYASAEPFLPRYYPGDFAWFNNQYQTGSERTSPFAPPTALTAVPVRPFDAGTNSLFMHAQLKVDDFEAGYVRTSESHPSATGVKPDFSLYVEDAVFQTDYSSLYGKHTYVSEDARWRLASQASYSLYEIDPRSKFLNTFSLYKDAFKYGYDRTLALDERLTLELSEAMPLILGFAYEDHSALAYSADLPRQFDTNQSAVSQGFNYPGSEVADLNGRSLAVPIQFHYLQYQNFGSFAQMQFNQWHGLQATVGARFDHNTRYGDSVNPRVGIVAHPAERLTLKLNYGEAFLAPSTFRSQAHFGTFVPVTNGLGQITGLQSFFFHLPNPDLRPEKLRQWDSDAAVSLTENMRASLNGYYTEATNLIQDDVQTGPGSFAGFPVAQVETAKNIGFARAYGVTARLEALARLGLWTLKPDAAYSYSAGKSAGDVLPYSAKHTIHSGLELSRGKLSLYPRLTYRARSYNRAKDTAGNLQSNAAFVVADVYVRYSDIIVKPFRVSSFLSVTNVTDQRYRNASFTIASVGFPATPQDPIRVVGGLVAEF